MSAASQSAERPKPDLYGNVCNSCQGWGCRHCLDASQLEERLHAAQRYAAQLELDVTKLTVRESEQRAELNGARAAYERERSQARSKAVTP